MQYFMLLEDGATFTSLQGCAIIRAPDDLEPEIINLSDTQTFEIIAAFDHESLDMTPTITLKAPLLGRGRATFPLEVTEYTLDNEQAVLYGQ